MRKVISANECKKISQILMKAISENVYQKYKGKNSNEDYGMVMVVPVWKYIFKITTKQKLIDPL